MPINSQHPELQKRGEEISRNRHAVEGERAVKGEGSTYLPIPPGMTGGPSGVTVLKTSGDRADGGTRYDFYRDIAEFPEELGESLQGFQGIIHSKPPKMKIPTALKYLEEKATPDGRTIEKLWTLMTEEVLTGGRIALLCDVVGDEILFAPYSVENVTNWQLASKADGERPDWVVLRERARIVKDDDPFETEPLTRWLELRMLFNEDAFEKQPDSGGFVYHRKVWEAKEGDTPEEASAFIPITLFGKYFEEIPIIVINALDLSFDFGPIPMSPLVKIAMSLYRRSADYNRSIYIKTDPQPVVFGVTDKTELPDRIGGEEIWSFSNPQGSASYLDIDGDGIPHQRTAMQDDWGRFHLQSAKLLQASETPSESGEAVRRKQAAKQVTLKAVTMNVAEGLETAMKKAGKYFAAATNSIAFTPDTDFSVPKMSGDEATKWAAAKSTGFPISDKSLHEMARLGGATEMTYEDELEAMENDAERVPPPAPPAPEGPPTDEEDTTEGEASPGGEDGGSA